MAWYNASWSNRVKVTALATKVDGDLTDFPIYVDLSDLPSGFHTNVNQTDARDIRVTEADGTTEVPREVVSYDSTGDTGELHFKGDVLGASDVDFYIYYGNGSATEPAIDTTYGAENVWNSAYLAVWHLEEDPSGSAPQMKDSTSNDNDGTSNGSMQSNDSVAGQIGNGLEFDTTDHIQTSLDFSGLTTFTVSQWINTQLQGSFRTLWCANGSSGCSGEGLFFNGGTGLRFRVAGTDQTVTISDIANTWTNVVATYNASDRVVYFDGVSVYSENGGSATNGTVDFQIANYDGCNAAVLFDGVIDEFRVSNVVRSVAWITTEQNNQVSPSTFFTVGSEESGGTVVALDLGVMTYTGFALAAVVTLNTFIALDVGAMTYTGFEPTAVVTNNINIDVDVGALTFIGFEPTVVATDLIDIDIDLGVLTYTGFALTAVVTGNQDIAIDVGALTYTGFELTAVATGGANIDLGLGVLTYTGFELTAVASDHIDIDIGIGSIKYNAFIPFIKIKTVDLPTVVITEVETSIIISKVIASVVVTEVKTTLIITE